MAKNINYIKRVLLSVTVLLLAGLMYGFFTVPDEIYAVSDEYLNVKDYYTINYCENALQTESLKRSVKDGQYKVQVKLFNAIPIKSSSLKVSNRKYVVPSGEILGLRFFTQGVVIVGIDSVDTAQGAKFPAQIAGLQKGDVITYINGKQATDSNSVLNIISSCAGESIEIGYMRDNNNYHTCITPEFSVSEGKYKAGLWIRDSAAGIGTMTFYDPESKGFAALGHAVCDVDTGEILPLSEGDVVKAAITGCYKGKQGQAGELCGVFTDVTLGLINVNCSRGVYGSLYNTGDEGELMPVATAQEVKQGKAKIISTVDDNGPCCFDAQIIKISYDDTDKNMVIEITDEKLIEKTGGIVQGMSGSPIIQDGKLVGAVTHVFISEPTKGYAIFAENMLNIVEQESVIGQAS